MLDNFDFFDSSRNYKKKDDEEQANSLYDFYSERKKYSAIDDSM